MQMFICVRVKQNKTKEEVALEGGSANSSGLGVYKRAGY